VSTRLVLALALALAAGIAGCGLGAGSGGGEARVLVTRDFGAKRLGARIEQSVPGSETAMRMLQRQFKVTTRYGGGFVQSIDGLAGGREAGHPVDWFFYVNGVQSQQGATEVDVNGGDSIWWDRHDWSATQNVPAVVGAYPEPFVHGAEGKRWPIVLECADDVADACTRIADRLAGDGARAVGRQALATGVGQDTLRVIVGPWREIGGDAALEQLAQGPSVSGVYARFASGGSTLDLLDPEGDVAGTLRAGAGLIAATRFEQQAPTWAITGTDVAGVTAAAAALGVQRLDGRFALAVSTAGDRPLPVQR
jgi:hypothetical protein